MRLDPLLRRLPKGEGKIPPYWGVPDEVVACCAINYDRIHGFQYLIEHRFWNLEAAQLASRISLTAGLKAPKGLNVPVFKKIPLAKALQLEERLGGLPTRFMYAYLMKEGVPKTVARTMLRGYSTVLWFEVWKEGLLQFLKEGTKTFDAGPLGEIQLNLHQSLLHRLRERLATAHFITGCWDAFRINVEVSNCDVLDTTSLREDLYRDPWNTAKKLKEFASQCRALAFEEPTEKNDIFRFLRIRSEDQLLQLANIGRSLPAPIYFNDPLPAYYARMAEPLEWEPEVIRLHTIWIQDWAKANAPKGEVAVGSAFTTSACIEFTRSKGGIPKALQIYALWQFCWEKENPRFDLMDGLVTEPPLASTWLTGERWRLVVGACVNFMHRYKGVLPAEAIKAPEKGLKVRVPTKTILPVIILGGFLRNIADQFLVGDIRIRPSITSGDPLRGLPAWLKKPDPGAVWRSLDCSFATDFFTFSYVERIYTALLNNIADKIPPKLLELLRDIVRFLASPRKLLKPDPDGCPVVWKKLAKRLFLGALREPFTEAEMPEWSTDEITPLESALFLRDMDLYWASLASTPNYWVITGRGAMMGDPISWPGLPLMTLFNWERVNPQSEHFNVITTGDDALGRLTPERNIAFSNSMTECKTVLSKGKDFTHPHLGVYTERITKDGVEQPNLAAAPLIGPPGGSKGESDWFSAPSSQIALNKYRHYEGLTPWSMSRFYPTWIAARRLGLPTHLPPRWGGLTRPTARFKGWRDQAAHARWGEHVSNRSNMDYVLGGTGLYFGEASTKVGTLQSILIRRGTIATMGRADGFDGTLAAYKKAVIGAEKTFTHLRGPNAAMFLKGMGETFVKLATSREGTDRFRDFPEKIRRVDQIDQLLKGVRPEGGKTPSVFTLSRRVSQVLARYRKPHGLPKSDTELIERRERYLDGLGSLMFQPGCGLSQMRGLPRLAKPYRELDPEGKVAFLYQADEVPALPFDNG
jgi:hypothetical protein